VAEEVEAVPPPEPAPASSGPAKLKVQAVLASGRPPLEKALSWKVFEAEADFEGNRKQVAWEIAPSQIFTLPPGRYLVTAEFGYARAEQEIEVEPGAQFARTLDLGAGQVKLTARRGAGGEPLAADVDWKVYRGEADFEGNRERIAWELTASPVLTLEAGDYLVVAGYGGLSAEKRFSLAPGEQKPIEVVFE